VSGILRREEFVSDSENQKNGATPSKNETIHRFCWK
jgi:hypothetical protein